MLAATTFPAPSFAGAIAPADLVAAVRLAFQTLLAILDDDKAPVRERRMAASAILRLAMPQTSPGRKPGVNQPSAQPPSPTPAHTVAPSSSRPDREPDPAPSLRCVSLNAATDARADTDRRSRPRSAATVIASAGAAPHHLPIQPCAG